MSIHDWFRSAAWDDEVATAFERRLQRARPWNRAQYLRIQATDLLESADPATREAGRRLLHRLVGEYPDNELEVNCAWEQLAESLMHDGQTEEAEHAFRRALALIAKSPLGRSGTSGVTELLLAELLLATRDSSGLGEAGQLLLTIRPEVERLTLLRNVVYRYLLASARLTHRAGNVDASELAKQALAVAVEPWPGPIRNQEIGRAKPTDEDLAELRMIASMPPPLPFGFTATRSDDSGTVAE